VHPTCRFPVRVEPPAATACHRNAAASVRSQRLRRTPVVAGREDDEPPHLVGMLRCVSPRADRRGPGHERDALPRVEAPDVIDRRADVRPVGGDRCQRVRIAGRAGARDNPGLRSFARCRDPFIGAGESNAVSRSCRPRTRRTGRARNAIPAVVLVWHVEGDLPGVPAPVDKQDDAIAEGRRPKRAAGQRAPRSRAAPAAGNRRHRDVTRTK